MLLAGAIFGGAHNVQCAELLAIVFILENGVCNVAIFIATDSMVALMDIAGGPGTTHEGTVVAHSWRFWMAYARRAAPVHIM